jgi:hypothetical protein
LSEKIQQGWMDDSVQKTGFFANGKQIQPNVQIRISIFINKMLHDPEKSNFRRPIGTIREQLVAPGIAGI